jgi:glycine dehydrogenase
MITDNFHYRHNGPRDHELPHMLQTIGVESIEELISRTIPSQIKLPKPLDLPKGKSEAEVYALLKTIGSKNKIFRSFIGMGYYNTILPPVIQRNILENPGWYTSYTPYQAEISQGRLEALLLFQTMVSDMTAMPVSNSSLLDEGTAAGEAMILTFNSRSREKVKSNANVFLASDKLFPQSLDVIIARAEPLGIDVKVMPYEQFAFEENVFGAIVQYPDESGEIHDFSTLAEKAHQGGSLLIAAVDIMAMALLTPPGEWGADVVVGTTQRFGVPMGYGGPHAAFLACKDEFKRNVPGRIIGVSIDSHGKRALRMALQTREQHIKRERATSNICTAQALLATMAAMYAAYHGPDGIKNIARHINILTGALVKEVEKLGYTQLNKNYFDTVRFAVPKGVDVNTLKDYALDAKINLRYIDSTTIGISFDETSCINDINAIVCVLARANGKPCVEFICDPKVCQCIKTFDEKYDRKSPFLTHALFNSYHSETDMMRYLKSLENKDLALNRTMIPLGSCTMKLNAAVEMFHLSWPEFSNIHPFVPADQAEGYLYLINDMDEMLSKITGFAKVSFQPNSGASGEYAGLMVIRQYHISRGQGHRNVCLIPSSAHGTNPASAAMAGMKIVVTKCDENGNVDLDDLKAKAEEHKNDLSALMITYPSTHGVFEEDVCEIVRVIHENGGQVYMDGANMNAQVGYTSPGYIGADVCHLNLHKTFAIPHGGGGPGVGPIGVAKHLVEFLPGHTVVKTGGQNAIKAISAAPFGSPLVLPISYAYMKLLGGNGLKKATDFAILNANYLKALLEKHYPILYVGKNGFVAHEMILDCNNFSKTAHVGAIDIAKRLIDYGFHAPTVAFPVVGTLMVEPTESEPLKELDRFVDAMIQIRNEIKEIEEGKASQENNVFTNAPHKMELLLDEEWKLPYPKMKAYMPVEMPNKYFPPVGRVNDAHGDRNLVCTCPPIEEYMTPND